MSNHPIFLDIDTLPLRFFPPLHYPQIMPKLPISENGGKLGKTLKSMIIISILKPESYCIIPHRSLLGQTNKQP